MKTFEERFTAWVDGALDGAELTDFEQELAQHPEAVAEKSSALKLGKFLREHPTAPSLANPDFFNLQIEQRIEREQRAAVRDGRRAGSLWSFPRMLWAGAACLLVAGVMVKTLIPAGSPPIVSSDSPYFAQVVEAWPSDPSIYASTVYTPEDNVTVLWLDGLDYIPASYKIQ